MRMRAIPIAGYLLIAVMMIMHFNSVVGATIDNDGSSKRKLSYSSTKNNQYSFRNKIVLSYKFYVTRAIKFARNFAELLRRELVKNCEKYDNAREESLENNHAELALLKEQWKEEDLLLDQECQREPIILCQEHAVELQNERSLEIDNLVQHVDSEKKIIEDSFLQYLVSLEFDAQKAINRIEAIIAYLERKLEKESSVSINEGKVEVEDYLGSATTDEIHIKGLIAETGEPTVHFKTICLEISDASPSPELKQNEIELNEMFAKGSEAALALSFVNDKVNAEVVASQVIAIEYVPGTLTRALQFNRMLRSKKGSVRMSVLYGVTANDKTDKLVSDIVGWRMRRRRHLVSDPEFFNSLNEFMPVVLAARGAMEVEPTSKVTQISCAEFL